MDKTTEHAGSISRLVTMAAAYNDNIGNYREHFINENFNYSVRLSNGYAVTVSRMLAQDFERLPSIVTEDDLKNIASSVRKIG